MCSTPEQYLKDKVPLGASSDTLLYMQSIQLKQTHTGTLISAYSVTRFKIAWRPGPPAAAAALMPASPG